MTKFKRICIIYSICILAILIIKMNFGSGISSMLRTWQLWVIPLLPILSGAVLGFLVSSIFKKPQSKIKVYNYSYLFALLIFIITATYLNYSSWRHNKDFGNIEANQDHFKYFPSDYAQEEKIAFDSLCSLIGPNSFRLTGGSIKGYDTILKNQNETVYFITFRYEKENPNHTLKAKFAVLRNKAMLFYYDRPLSKVEIYEIDIMDKTAKKTLTDAIQVLPDTLKSVMTKEFDDILEQ